MMKYIDYKGRRVQDVLPSKYRAGGSGSKRFSSIGVTPEQKKRLNQLAKAHNTSLSGLVGAVPELHDLAVTFERMSVAAWIVSEARAWFDAAGDKPEWWSLVDEYMADALDMNPALRHRVTPRTNGVLVSAVIDWLSEGIERGDLDALIVSDPTLGVGPTVFEVVSGKPLTAPEVLQAAVERFSAMFADEPSEEVSA
ncbi:hypothetical protein F4X86_04265 [Candidatus Saccharibacteria bacterium]|nr:hypothetical protein [Candidatus Saccharibacteria bacterium]